MFDEKEFNSIVETYYKIIFRYCLSKLNFDDYYSADIANKVFNLLFEKWDELDLDNNVLAWLYRVADNYIKKHWAKIKKNKEESLEVAIEIGKLENNDLFYTTIEFDVDITVDEELIKIAQELPEELRQLFIYRVIEKKTFSEICSITGLPYTTVNNKVERAKKKAEQIIKQNYF